MAELEDEEFEKLLLEKQHREMISSLTLMVKTLEKVGSSDASIIRAIQQNSESVIEFVKKIAEQKPTQSPIASEIAGGGYQDATRRQQLNEQDEQEILLICEAFLRCHS